MKQDTKTSEEKSKTWKKMLQKGRKRKLKMKENKEKKKIKN